MTTNQEFYDKFLNKLITDYAFGNKRIESAIKFALNSLPRGNSRVLDIGFGLGWSSQEIIRNLPQSRVDGIDLSPKLVEFSEKLCNDPRANFCRQDLTEWVPEKNQQYDAVLMLDVYEHIPHNVRRAFHDGLRRVLRPNGILILTCPSKKHQDYLRKFIPEGLQPVDEDVTHDVAEEIAQDLGLKLLKFEEQNVWSEGDYNHILVGPASDLQHTIENNFELQSPQERRSRLLKNCLIRAHHPGIISTAQEGCRVCIASPSLDSYSETFIRRHVEQLPFDVLTLSGQRLDIAADEWLLRESFGQRLCHYSARKLRRFDEAAFVSDRQAAWLKREGVRAVLAEYGFTGVAMADACRKAEVPLIVHFHGYDAHNEEAVAPYRDAYRKLFQQAAAVVAVSWPMIERLVELGCERSKLIRIPYSLDPESFVQSQPGTNAPVFISVGRFVEKKAPHLLLLAFAGVLRVFPEARLEMAGDGPLLGASKWQARALGIEHAVTFHGSKPHAWVAAAMQRVRAFVQHSVRAENGDSEGMPVAVLEAQCAGLPVIATRHAGIPEVVVQGETGFLCDEGDVDQMSADMIRVLGMGEEDARMMGNAARARILTEFSREKTLDRLSEVVRGVGLAQDKV